MIIKSLKLISMQCLVINMIEMKQAHIKLLKPQIQIDLYRTI